jgi:ketosteroid isomerase-like protein
MDSARMAFERSLATFDDLFRHDAGAAIADWFAADAQLLWPEEAPIIGPQAIGRAFADFAEAFETISFEPDHGLVEVVSPLAVTVGTFIETRRERATGVVERVHGRVVTVWRADPEHGWRIVRAMTSRYAATEILA